MKVITGLLVGAAMLVSGVADAQYYSQASVSGVVLSYGPMGLMLQGPDGNYGIVVNQATVITDPWGTYAGNGPATVQVGDYVTASGYPRSQWVLQATRMMDRDINVTSGYPVYGPFNGTGLAPGGVIRTPNMFPGIQQGISGPTVQGTFTFPTITQGITPFNTLPVPANSGISP